MADPIAASLSVPPHGGENHLRGLTFMALGFFLFAFGDMLAKLLTDHLNPFQIVWFRQAGLLMGVLVLLALRGAVLLRSAKPALQIGRGVAAVCSACCFIFAIQHVPLADATAVSFVAPFIVTILGALILRESVGIRRWVAVAIGFVGMLIVIRPGAGVLHPAILLVVVAASAFAVRQVLSRWLSGADSIATTIVYTSLTSSAILTLVQPFVWVTPKEMVVWGMLAAMSAAAALGEVLIIRALSMTEAVVLAPVHYSLILWSTFYGYLVFADLPDGFTVLGCAIIVLSGAYTLHRERQAARRQP